MLLVPVALGDKMVIAEMGGKVVSSEMVEKNGDSCDGGRDGSCHRFPCGGHSCHWVDVLGRDCRSFLLCSSSAKCWCMASMAFSMFRPICFTVYKVAVIKVELYTMIGTLTCISYLRIFS